MLFGVLVSGAGGGMIYAGAKLLSPTLVYFGIVVTAYGVKLIGHGLIQSAWEYVPLHENIKPLSEAEKKEIEGIISRLKEQEKGKGERRKKK